VTPHVRRTNLSKLLDDPKPTAAAISFTLRSGRDASRSTARASRRRASQIEKAAPACARKIAAAVCGWMRHVAASAVNDRSGRASSAATMR
jgi:hypothetical protein